MKAHRDFTTEGGGVEIKQKEHLKRELRIVPKLWDDSYPDFIRKFLFQQVDPRSKFKDFRVDMDYTDLDCYDEVEDFIFSERE